MAEGFIKLRSYWSPDEANLAKLHLEAHGIPVELEGANMVATAWIDANAVGGVKLLVKASDAEDAQNILNQHSETSTILDAAEESEFPNESTNDDEDTDEEANRMDSSPGALVQFRSFRDGFIWAFLALSAIVVLPELIFAIAHLLDLF